MGIESFIVFVRHMTDHIATKNRKREVIIAPFHSITVEYSTKIYNSFGTRDDPFSGMSFPEPKHFKNISFLRCTF